MYLTAKIYVEKSNPLYKHLDEYAWKSKNLYNFSLYYLRNTWFIDRKIREDKDLDEHNIEFLNKLEELCLKNGKEFQKYNKENKDFKYNDFVLKNLTVLLKKEEPYTIFEYSRVASNVLRQTQEVWKSYKAAFFDWCKHPDKYEGMPEAPKFKKRDKGNSIDDTGRYLIPFCNQTIKVDNDNNLIITSKHLKHIFVGDKKDNSKPLIKINLDFIGKDDIDVKTIDFIKDKHKDQYVGYISYDNRIEVPKFDKDKVIFNDNMNRVISIDLGVDKFATIVNNFNEKPISIKSGELLSKLALYQGKLDFYKSENKKCNGKEWSKNQSKLQIKMNNYKNTWIHNKTAFIIKYCKENNIDTIIMGYNKEWKQSVNLGTKNNKKFGNLPYKTFLDKLIYKCQLNGINLIVTEESYTSGCSFIDGEKPNKENYNKTRRIKRGLFQSNGGIYIHSDVNGAYNIMNKVVDYSWNGNKKILHPSIV